MWISIFSKGIPDNWQLHCTSFVGQLIFLLQYRASFLLACLHAPQKPLPLLSPAPWGISNQVSFLFVMIFLQIHKENNTICLSLLISSFPLFFLMYGFPSFQSLRHVSLFCRYSALTMLYLKYNVQGGNIMPRTEHSHFSRFVLPICESHSVTTIGKIGLQSRFGKI